MFSLIFAGEAIFTLPFHITRYFRPTYVDVLGVTQTQIGILGSTYGVVAMISYLFGGVLADRFSARKLLAFSLVITGATGFYVATIPSFAALQVVYGFWGASTILPFWASLIRATRDWGGESQQGRAFGILDGGRGLLAAVLATVVFVFFAMILPADDAVTTPDQKLIAIRTTIYIYTGSCFAAAVLVWLFVPETTAQRKTKESNKRGVLTNLTKVLRMPVIWLHAGVIVAAYSAFKGMDFYGQFTSDVWNWSDVSSARLTTMSTWIRPLAAIGAGFLADRFTSSRMITVSFVLAGVVYIGFVVMEPGTGAVVWLLWANILVGCLGIFALRGVYFALLEEARIPREFTGTAVGVVSFIGYTPEIFIPIVGGKLIDHWQSGPMGYNVLFGIFAVCALLGIVANGWMSFFYIESEPS
ncbi:MAG: MFS transporter [Pirellulaceae bacterium]|nr:MFS transporter [Pirellulaceae bacterium]